MRSQLDVVVVGEGPGPLIVLLHGFGAPGDDLVSLARAIRAPKGTRFAFPAAPISLSMMPGMDSRAWWNIDMMRLQLAMERGELRDLTRGEPDGLTEARAAMDAVLSELRTKLSPTKLVLGGFSQGSMLAVDVALRTEQKVDALVVLSGTLVAEEVWVPRMKVLAGLPIFQSHGVRDPILPYALAERLRDELAGAGAAVTFASFRGGHEIPMPVLDALGTFLGGALGADA